MTFFRRCVAWAQAQVRAVETVPPVRRCRRILVCRAAVSVLTAAGMACGGVADDGKLPSNVPDPATLHTPSGAVARYRSVLSTFPRVFDSLVALTGVLTDELNALPAPLGVRHEPYTSLDSRRSLSGFDALYSRLHYLRGQAREARGFLAAYAPDSPLALAAHLYAVEGYAEVFLAEVFCSGIPLSTVDFNADYTLAAGSSTAEVYRHAVALFDSALAISGDSMQIQSLAAVGRGRALLGLGRYAEAAAVVAAVPDDYRYQVVFAPPGFLRGLLQEFADGSTGDFATGYGKFPSTPSAADREGGTGLDYRSSGDPRTSSTAQPDADPLGNTMYYPDKYPLEGPITLTVADGVEARLIQAEAALQANADDGQWLAILNHLRQTAIVPALPDTTDPGPDANSTDQSRIDLLFRERAFWLFLTGHRQGDLRRLIRNYLRSETATYPTGLYSGGDGSYGREVVAPVPEVERTLNPKYTGCANADA